MPSATSNPPLGGCAINLILDFPKAQRQSERPLGLVDLIHTLGDALANRSCDSWAQAERKPVSNQTETLVTVLSATLGQPPRLDSAIHGAEPETITALQRRRTWSRRFLSIDNSF